MSTTKNHLQLVMDEFVTKTKKIVRNSGFSNKLFVTKIHCKNLLQKTIYSCRRIRH